MSSKNNMYNRNDSKIIRLRAKFGSAGYGIYIMLLEMLSEESSRTLQRDYAYIAYLLHEEEETVRSIVEDYDLFVIQDDCFFVSLNSDRKRERAVKAAQVRWNKSCNKHPQAMLSDATSINKQCLEMQQASASNAKSCNKHPQASASIKNQVFIGDASIAKHDTNELEKEREEKEKVIQKEKEDKEKDRTDERKILDEVESDEAWCESIAMNHSMTTPDVKRRYGEFRVDSACRGKRHRDVNDVKQHFNSWLNVKARIAASEAMKKGREPTAPPGHLREREEWLRGM